MQLSTKKCILTYSGAVMFAFGFLLMTTGLQYSTLLVLSPSSVVSNIVTYIPHWCGMLLVLLGARNFTFGLAQWKYGMNCCGNGACEVIFVNFLALLVSAASVGIPIYSSFEHLKKLVDTPALAESDPELVILISMWFMGLVSAILSLLSMCAGCLPVGSVDMDENEPGY